MRIPVAMFLALVACVSFHQNLVEANFYDNVKFNWGSHLSYIWNNGNNLQLKLDNTSGKRQLAKSKKNFSILNFSTSKIHYCAPKKIFDRKVQIDMVSFIAFYFS